VAANSNGQGGWAVQVRLMLTTEKTFGRSGRRRPLSAFRGQYFSGEASSNLFMEGSIGPFGEYHPACVLAEQGEPERSRSEEWMGRRMRAPMLHPAIFPPLSMNDSVLWPATAVTGVGQQEQLASPFSAPLSERACLIACRRPPSRKADPLTRGRHSKGKGRQRSNGKQYSFHFLSLSSCIVFP
jgi:hypothetical protein